jgi:hypothetical protein
VPLSASSVPASTRKSVDFPLPFRPKMPTLVWAGKENEIPSSTTFIPERVGYAFVILSKSIT